MQRFYSTHTKPHQFKKTKQKKKRNSHILVIYTLAPVAQEKLREVAPRRYIVSSF